MSRFECHLCGSTDSHHTKEECHSQQDINAKNIAKDGGCRWCGGRGGHREGCPRFKKDKVTVRRVGRTTIITTECGYCHAKSENRSTSPNAQGMGGGASWGGGNHNPGCPRQVHVRMASP